MIYLFVGEDAVSKQTKIQALRQQLLIPNVEQYNYESLDTKGLSLAGLKESLARLPVSSKNRLLIIRDIHKLKDDLKAYLLEKAKDLPQYLTIVLDAPCIARDDYFIPKISKVSKVISFKTPQKEDIFSLVRAIERRQPDYALNLLADLIRAGERPEKILGGIRHQLTKYTGQISQMRRKIGLLLETDVRIKTGRLKPEYALEILIVRLCC